MKYQIAITETLQKIVDVEADTASDAIVQVTRDYSKGEINLDGMDYVGFDIREYKE